MSDLKIRQCFETRLAAWSAARVPPLPIAYEDRAFTPPADGASYLMAFLLPANAISDDLEGAHTGYAGLFQVSVVTKSGVGRGVAGLIAEEIADLYPNNLQLSKAGFSVFVRSPMLSAPTISGETTNTLPLRFQYRADTYW